MSLESILDHKKLIEDFMNDSKNEDRLKFLNFESYMRAFTVKQDDWMTIERISVVSGVPIAYFSAEVSRDSYTITSLAICNISKNSGYVSTKDMLSFLDYLLKIKKFKKISFSCYIGNPAEKMYDKIIKKYNGDIVGIQKKHNKLCDGNYYDKKMYEILNFNE